MLNYFSTQNPLGIDINETSIKIALLNNRGQLELLSKIDLPDSCIVNGEIEKKDELIKAIRKIIKDTPHITTNEIICSLPEKITYFKILEFAGGGDTNNQIKSVLADHIPEEIEKLNLDWKILNTKKGALNNESIKVVLGAGPKNLIEDYIRVLDQSDLIPISLELEACAIARAIINEKDASLIGKTIGIFCVNKTYSIFIIYNNYVQFSIVLPFSEEKITDLIANGLNIDPRQAQKAKELCGLAPEKADGAIKTVLEPYLIDLFKKIKFIESYHIDYQNGKNLDKIILCGDLANLENLNQMIEAYTKIQVEIGNPLANLKVGSKKNVWQKYNLQSYITSIGLAINGLNIAKNRQI